RVHLLVGALTTVERDDEPSVGARGDSPLERFEQRRGGDGSVDLGAHEAKGFPASVPGSRGRPRMRSAIWLRVTSFVPPPMVTARPPGQRLARRLAVVSSSQITPDRPESSTAISERR